MTESNPLFSTYTQGENRITSTMLSVFEHISSGLVEDVIGTLLADELPLLVFENQLRGDESVPDGTIRGPSVVYFETKRVRDAVGIDQLENHLEQLTEEPANNQRLIVLTPDAERPGALGEIDDDRIEWASFDDLSSAIESVLDHGTGHTGDENTIPTEREAFLLRELNRFLYAEALLSGTEDRVLVVPAKRAWPEYKQTGLYFCQSERYFRPADHIAFHADGEIKPLIPRILDSEDNVRLTKEGIDEIENDRFRKRVDESFAAFPDLNPDRLDRELKVLLLKREPDLELDRPVINDKTASDSDRKVAFVRNQRYASLSDLCKSPEYTSELER
jgi:hypothetical protein